MLISVKLFSMFRYYAGVDQVVIELESGAAVTDLLKSLAARFDNPVFADDTSLLMVMVNQKNASPQTILNNGDVVHLLPILGGG